MNCFAKKTSLLIVALTLSTACNVPAESVVGGASLAYDVNYSVVPLPADGTFEVTMRVGQSQSLLRELRFQTDSRISAVSADGELRVDSSEVVWRPPAATGGSLRWTVAVAHRRNNNGYDAWLDKDWGLLRAEDIIPRASTRVLRGAFSKTTLQFELPQNWSVITAYRSDNGSFFIDKAERQFDQPDGWILVGQLGIRRETIAGVRVAVAGPMQHQVRRMDTLALLSWTLPELSALLPGLPQRLTIVSAGDPMWRGGLSAPQSLYVHADRPLISENATSTLLHEVMHSMLRIRADAGFDWIVEGIAEYYSLELLRRSGSISQSRHATALKDQEQWSKSAGKLCQRASTGATTALAVVVMAALDAEIRSATQGNASLDNVLQVLENSGQAVDLQQLTRVAEELSGTKLNTLRIDSLPGCRSIEPGNQVDN